LRAGINFFPSLFTNDEVDCLPFPLLVAPVVVDVVHPTELLSAIAPLVRKRILLLDLLETEELLLDRW
jgi:hypothetical protein